MNFTDKDFEVISSALSARNQYLENILKRLKDGEADDAEKAALEYVISEELARTGIGSDGEINGLGKVMDEAMGKLGFRQD